MRDNALNEGYRTKYAINGTENFQKAPASFASAALASSNNFAVETSPRDAFNGSQIGNKKLNKANLVLPPITKL